ncbi:MAG: hypothetical protein U0414_42670 [Polyangiaceae bacterium]
MTARGARAVGSASLALALLACGAEVPRGGVRVAGDGVAGDRGADHTELPDTAAEPLEGRRRVEPEELLPGDLDFTVRINMLRVRESLGQEVRAFLGELESEPLLAKAVERARSVTVSMRVSDLELGDRVIAVEGELAGLAPDEELYRREDAKNDRVKLWTRKREVMRDETAAIVALDERALVFVSPVELDSVKRVLAHGPDKDRPDPAADGFASVEYKPRRLSPSLARKYPSIAKLIGELRTVRGTIEVSDDGVKADVMITAKTDEGATHTAKFIDILRSNTDEDGLSKLLRGMDAELTGTAVHVKWVLPPALILPLLRGGEATRPAASPSNGAAPPTPEQPPRERPRTDG